IPRATPAIYTLSLHDALPISGPLSEAERLDLQRHPVIGEQEAARAGAERAVQLLVRWHHEWFSGAGYPDALRGEQIPLGARILRSEEHTSELQSRRDLVCRLL